MTGRMVGESWRDYVGRVEGEKRAAEIDRDAALARLAAGAPSTPQQRMELVADRFDRAARTANRAGGVEFGAPLIATVRLLRTCARDGGSPVETAFACELTAALLGDLDNKPRP